MADEDTAAPEEEQAGSGKKGMVMFILVVVAAVSASIGGTLYFMQSSEPEAVASEEELAEPLPQAAIYHNLRPPFIVNFVAGNKPRYLQAELTVMSRDPKVVEAVIQHSPLVRSRIIDLFADQDYLALQTPEGKEALREELKTQINEVLVAEGAEGGVEEVLITNFVMQ